MPHVDGFLVALRKDQIAACRTHAETGADAWMKHGALSVTEALAEDAPAGGLTSFPRAVEMREYETVILSFVTHRDRAHGDEVVASVMADPRPKIPHENLPCDLPRLVSGGFDIFIHR